MRNKMMQHITKSTWDGWVTFSRIMKEYMHISTTSAITQPKYKYIGSVIEVSRLVLWEKYVRQLNKG